MDARTRGSHSVRTHGGVSRCPARCEGLTGCLSVPGRMGARTRGSRSARSARGAPRGPTRHHRIRIRGPFARPGVGVDPRVAAAGGGRGRTGPCTQRSSENPDGARPAVRATRWLSLPERGMLEPRSRGVGSTRGAPQPVRASASTQWGAIGACAPSVGAVPERRMLEPVGRSVASTRGASQPVPVTHGPPHGVHGGARAHEGRRMARSRAIDARPVGSPSVGRLMVRRDPRALSQGSNRARAQTRPPSGVDRPDGFARTRGSRRARSTRVRRSSRSPWVQLGSASSGAPWRRGPACESRRRSDECSSLGRSRWSTRRCSRCACKWPGKGRGGAGRELWDAGGLGTPGVGGAR